MNTTRPAAAGETSGNLKPDEDIDALIDRLRSADYATRLEARRRLTAAGSAAVPVLIATLRERNWRLRWAAAKALSEIRDPLSAPALVHRLCDRRFGVRWLAGTGLIALGEHAVEPVLRQLRRRSSSTFLNGAERVLKGIIRQGATPETEETLRPVIAALEGLEAHLTSPIEAKRALDQLGERRKGRQAA
ncbi:MAG: HEAT repeat domain-containing protein [Dehalococcoidia bacterium]|nr:HEAT repeat domain-containing protein [Dehalococcoidia bacterium]